jgi:hypothetical protein
MTRSKRSSNPMAKNALLRNKAFALIALAVIGLAACKTKPTYSATRVAEELRKLCLKDYKLDVETRHSGGNLQAFFWRVGLVKGEPMEIQPEAAEALERVLLCATRISLSTDAPLQFLEVKMIDALSGASITLWRFVPDIRDSMYMRMAEDEYLNRLVVQFDAESGEKREWKEVRWDAPLTMSQFLAKQVVLRSKRLSPVGLQAHEDLSDPSTLTVVLDNWALIEKQGGAQGKEVTDLVEKTMKTVVGGYRFRGFHEFVLKDGRGLPLRRGLL